MSNGGNNLFALAAAHGITARTAATWYPFLPRTPRVLVPINLEALVVRQVGGAWAKTGMAPVPANAPEPIEIKTLLPPPFQNLDAARPRGAYLHWALPDALTRGTSQVSDGSNSSDTSFPAIPGR